MGARDKWFQKPLAIMKYIQFNWKTSLIGTVLIGFTVAELTTIEAFGEEVKTLLK